MLFSDLETVVSESKVRLTFQGVLYESNWVLSTPKQLKFPKFKLQIPNEI